MNLMRTQFDHSHTHQSCPWEKETPFGIQRPHNTPQLSAHTQLIPNNRARELICFVLLCWFAPQVAHLDGGTSWGYGDVKWPVLEQPSDGDNKRHTSSTTTKATPITIKQPLLLVNCSGLVRSTPHVLWMLSRVRWRPVCSCSDVLPQLLALPIWVHTAKSGILLTLWHSERLESTPQRAHKKKEHTVHTTIKQGELFLVSVELDVAVQNLHIVEGSSCQSFRHNLRYDARFCWLIAVEFWLPLIYFSHLSQITAFYRVTSSKYSWGSAFRYPPSRRATRQLWEHQIDLLKRVLVSNLTTLSTWWLVWKLHGSRKTVMNAFCLSNILCFTGSWWPQQCVRQLTDCLRMRTGIIYLSYCCCDLEGPLWVKDLWKAKDSALMWSLLWLLVLLISL